MGLTSAFLGIDQLPETLNALLAEVGRTYVPVMLANASAIDRGQDKVATVVEGKNWEQVPFPYQAKCLQWLRIEYSKLSGEEQEAALAILNGSGCEQLLQKHA